MRRDLPGPPSGKTSTRLPIAGKTPFSRLAGEHHERLRSKRLPKERGKDFPAPAGALATRADSWGRAPGRRSAMTQKPRVIFFDLGNTLVTATAETAHRLLAARLELTEKEAKKAGRLLMTSRAGAVAPLAAELGRLLPRRDPLDIQREVSRLWDEQYHSIREIEGAGPLLRALKAMGFPLGLISNTWPPHYAGFCRACPELSRLFDHNILSFALGVKKPSAAIFTHALDAAGRVPPECLFVGDSFELDIQPAAAIGFQTVWVLSRPERERTAIARMLRKELEPPGPVAENLEQVRRVIEEMGPP